jgi:aminoglycoside phosphotransferase (APT) family kinase protein
VPERSLDRWVVGDRMAGGMQAGAWHVRDERTGSDAVLKWIDVDAADAATVIEHARGHGYPTPRWLDHGTTEDGRSWCVLELVHGTPMGNMDVRGAHTIVELVALQRTITPPTERAWPATRRTDELVHSDLSVANILLADDGRVAGVIDAEESARGCAALDLLAPAANAIVWGSDPAGVDVLQRYLFDSYRDDEIAACADIVVREVGGWYERRMPEEWPRVGPALDAWRHTLP